jgi:hypothetical protein
MHWVTGPGSANMNCREVQGIATNGRELQGIEENTTH